jgi:hypothetical protein
MGRIVACGDGGGGTSGAGAFPTNPQNGDDYFETDANGRYTHYKYNSANAIWQLVGVILPPAYVRDSPLPGFLSGIPINQVVHGPDGLVYHYEEANGSWVGELLEFEFPDSDNLPIDIAKYLNCFDLTNGQGAKYKLTVFVEEPKPGSGYEKVGINVGHTFIGLSKEQNGIVSTQYVGFYPFSQTLIYPTAQKIVDNGGSAWTVSASFDVSDVDFANAVNQAATLSSLPYHVRDNNCTDYVYGVMSAANISLPKTPAQFPWPYDGTGNSPGNLGADLRNLRNYPNYNISTLGGNAPSSKGPCN